MAAKVYTIKYPVLSGLEGLSFVVRKYNCYNHIMSVYIMLVYLLFSKEGLMDVSCGALLPD